MYARELPALTPAQRLKRMGASLETRFADWERALYRHFERAFEGRYSGRALGKRLPHGRRPADAGRGARSFGRCSVRTPADLLAPALAELPKPLRDAFAENRAAGVVWWEDAVAEGVSARAAGIR